MRTLVAWSRVHCPQTTGGDGRAHCGDFSRRKLPCDVIQNFVGWHLVTSKLRVLKEADAWLGDVEGLDGLDGETSPDHAVPVGICDLQMAILSCP